MNLKAAIFLFMLASPLHDVAATLRGGSKSEEVEDHQEQELEHRELATCSSKRCGTSWSNANGKCGVDCTSNPDSGWSGQGVCPSGEKCFADIATNLGCCTTTAPPPSDTGNLGDWEFCSTSSQCRNGCCSKQYSNDGKLKCTPLNGGFNANICVTSGGTTPPPSGGGGITSPGKTLTIADLQAGLTKYSQLQGGSVTATQALVDKLNSATSGWSLYRQIAFTAHAIWESAGLQYTEEIAATTAPYSTRNNYQTCNWSTGAQATNGQVFYGRGYMQLSWCANYLAYGQARMINGDANYFYNNPSVVATTYAWDSAAWFFSANVPDTTGTFGLTTKSINGPIECVSSNNYVGSAPQKRYQIFQALAAQVGLTGYTEGGCYN